MFLFVYKILLFTVLNFVCGEEPDFISREECGRVIMGPGKEGRILKGEEAYHGEYPWQVALYKDYLFALKRIYCGGSLINRQWIVTAAHCLASSTLASDYVVALGEHDIHSSKESKEAVVLKGSKLISHPMYDSDTFQYDVALLKLEKPVVFDDHIQPICLPTVEARHLVGEFVVATGWGKYFENGRSAGILQEVALPIIRNKDCELMFIEIGEETRLDDYFVCAGYKNGKKDTCSGDSGGPLQYRVKDGRWELIGIVSWGYGCGRKMKPGLSTRVGKVEDWIKKQINDDEDEENFLF